MLSCRYVSMFIYKHLFAYVWMYVPGYACLHNKLCMCEMYYVRTYVLCVYVYMYVCMYLVMFVCVYLCMFVCIVCEYIMYVCMYACNTCMYVCMYACM